jgi:hypothetical protein
METSPLFRDSRPMNALRLLSRRRLAAAAGAVATVTAVGAVLGPGPFAARPGSRHVVVNGAPGTSREDVRGGIMDHTGLPGKILGGVLAPLKEALGQSSRPASGATASNSHSTPAGAQSGHVVVSGASGAVGATPGAVDPARSQPILGTQQAPGVAPGVTPGAASGQTKKEQASGAAATSQGGSSRHDAGGHQVNKSPAPAPSPTQPVTQRVAPTSTVTATPTSTVTPTASPSPQPTP